MAIALDATASNTGTGKTSAANLVHAANVMVLIAVSYAGTTSPSSVSVGANNATYLTGTKSSYSTVNTVEIWYYYSTGAATDSVTPTFASNTRHAWCAISYTGVKSTSSFETIVIANGTGASPATATVTIGAGTSGRWAFSAISCADSGTGSYTITIAPANSETERKEADLAGGSSAKAVSCQIQDYNDSASRAMKNTGTASGRTIDWAIATVGILARVPADISESITLSRSIGASPKAGQIYSEILYN